MLLLLGCGSAGLLPLKGPPESTDPPEQLEDSASDSGEPADSEPADSEPADSEDSDGDPTVAPARRMWSLAVDETTWRHVAVDPAAEPHAPDSFVEAAVGIEDLDRLWVLTASQIHVLRVEDQSWVDSMDRDLLFPDLAGEPVATAMYVPAFWGGTSVASLYLLVDGVAWIYNYDVESLEMSLYGSTDLADWTSELAADPEAVAAGWLAVDDESGWAPGDPHAICGADAERLGPYFTVLTSLGLAHTYDAGWCMDFVDERAADLYSVFGLPGAPDPADLTAIDWTGRGLVAFTE